MVAINKVDSAGRGAGGHATFRKAASEVATWCREHGAECVQTNALKPRQGNRSRNKAGVSRVMEVLECTMWGVHGGASEGGSAADSMRESRGGVTYLTPARPGDTYSLHRQGVQDARIDGVVRKPVEPSGDGEGAGEEGMGSLGTPTATDAAEAGTNVAVDVTRSTSMPGGSSAGAAGTEDTQQDAGDEMDGFDLDNMLQKVRTLCSALCGLECRVTDSGVRWLTMMMGSDPCNPSTSQVWHPDR